MILLVVVAQKVEGKAYPHLLVLFAKLNFGKVKLSNNKELSIGQLTDWMFQNGYDTRAFVAELIPVIIFETLIRCYWFYKQKFYYGKSFKESLPIANSRELSRLLLVGNATFTSIDTTHATIKGVIKLVGMALILERL